MKKRSALAALAAALVACTPAEPPHDARRADQKGELALATGSADQPGAPSACKPPAREALGADRAAATRSFVAGAHREAIAELGALVRRRPNDLASLALLLAARQRQEAAATRASDELTRLASVRLRAPSGAQQTNRKLDIPPRELKLQRVAERKNLITDDEVFHQKHGVTRAELAEHRAGVEDLPDAAPRALGNARAFRVFSHADHDIVSYGTALLYMPRVGPTRIYDITNLHQVQDAQMVGDALIVASWRNGYAKDVQNQTAYLTAHDQATGELLWQSDPLVSSGPFLVTGSHIISGYGFTAEPDFVFLIDLATGKTVQREALQSGPSMIVLRGDRVHLRNYDTDAEFKLSPAPTAAPAVAAPKEPPTAAPDAAIVCEVERAIVAIDARDVGQLLQTIGALRSAQERELAASLEGVRGFLEQQAGSQPGIDLWRRPPSVLPPPPWERTLVKPAGAPVTHQPRLSPLARADTRPRSFGRKPFDPLRPFFLAPVENGKLPEGARPDIPTSYAQEPLRAIIPNGDGRLLLIYGGRYLAIVGTSGKEQVFDFESYRHPPKVDPASAQFAVADLTYAAVQGGVLFAANGGGSYAKEMFGKKGFVSAIDLGSGQLLWRSDPLVHGPGPFAFWRDFLVTGYGFTAEPDNAFLLRRDTGEVAAKATLRSAPDEILVNGDVAEFETYDGSEAFSLALR